MQKQFSIQDGWLKLCPTALSINLAESHSTIRHVPSPNFNQRPNCNIYLIVLHNISLPPEQFGGGYIEQFFLNQLDSNGHPYFKTIAQVQVSAHVLILRTGEVLQFVNFNQRAWHAGRSSYLGVPECNDYSIGIELEGSDNKPFSAEQYAVLTQVIAAINEAYPMTINHLAGHSDIARGRKTDPGCYFDWHTVRQSLRQIKP